MMNWKLIASIAIIAGGLLVSFHYGQKDRQADWDAESRQIADALVISAKAARDKEQSLQNHMNEVQANASQQAEKLQADADSATDAASRLRKQVGELLASGGSKTASACSSRPAAENPGNLLAVLLDKSVTRNRELAAFADSALNAAKSCAAAYEKARG